MEVILADEVLGECVLNGLIQLRGACVPGEIDQGSRRTGDRDFVELLTIDRLESFGPVNHGTVAAHVALDVEHDVERPPQRETTEAVQSRSSRPAHPNRIADIEQQFDQLGSQRRRRAGDTKRVRACLHEGTAPDPAPKLAVGQARIRGLRATERAQLTG